MRLFLTGATGFIGSRIAEELQQKGHQIVGLARSQESAGRLRAAGIEIQPGTLDEPDTLLPAVDNVDAVIHTAFDHDFSRFAANCEKDRRVILALSRALAGSQRPLIITSGTGMGDPENGQPATEAIFNPAHPNPRIASELAANAALEKGIDVRIVRLPQVHDTRRQGLISYYIQLCRKKAASPGLKRGPTAGRRPMWTMWPGCTAPCWREERAANVIMRLPKRRFRPALLAKRWRRVCSCRRGH